MPEAQTVVEMYASAKYLTYDFIANVKPHSSREGILPWCSHEWAWVDFYLNENGIGGTYKTSSTIKILVSGTYPYHVLPPGPDIVAGILAYWARRTLFSLACPHEPMRVTGFLLQPNGISHP